MWLRLLISHQRQNEILSPNCIEELAVNHVRNLNPLWSIAADEVIC